MTQLTVVGRSSPGGPVDDLTLESGHWPTQPDQVVLNDARGPGESIGTQITVTGVPGSPQLTVVGFATSITQTAQAWVLPSEVAALRAPGAPDVSQMLYRFSSAATAAQINADIASVRAALPHGSVLGAESYLTVKLQDTGSIAPWVPFIVAFGVIGLVMSALIVANVVSGAVVAGTRRIGVLKSIGFSPGQVVASYVIQVAVPAFVGCVARRGRPATCCRCRCSARPRRYTASARWPSRCGSTWPCRWPCSAWPAPPRCCSRCARAG